MNQLSLFKGLLSQGSALCLVTDAKDTIVYLSPLMSHALGVHVESIVAKTMKEAPLPSDFIDLMAVNTNIVKGSKESAVVTVASVGLPGDHVYEGNITPILDDEGQIEFIMVTFTDITEHEHLKIIHYYIDQILHKLQNSNDIDNSMPKVMRDVAVAFDADISTILFRQDRGWYVKYAYGLSKAGDDAHLHEGQAMLAPFIEKTKAVTMFTQTAGGETLFDKHSSDWGIRAMMAIPMHIQGDIFGILTVAYRRRSEEISRTRREHLEKVAGIISLAFSEDRYIWSRETESAPIKRNIDSLKVGMAIIDGKDGSVKWANSIYNAVVPLRYHGAKITSMPYLNRNAEVGEVPPEEVFDRVISTGEQISYGCLEERNQSGVLKYWQVVLIPLANKKKVHDVMCLVIDVTEWEKTNNKNVRMVHAIQEEHYRVHTLLESVPVGVYISDAEGQILEMSSMGTKIWGENTLPRSIEEYGEYEAYRPGNGDRMQVEDWPLTKAVLKGETTIGEIIDYRAFDGRRGTVINSAAPIRNRHGRVIGAVEIDQDITELKNLERSLESTKAHLEAIINQMPAGIAIAEAPSGRITNCNNELKNLLFKHRSLPTSIDGYTAFGLLNPDDLTPLGAKECPLAKAILENRTVVGHQNAVRKADGSLMTVLTSASPIVGKDGTIIGAAAIFTDITHQKEVERKLEQQTRDLAHFNADLQRFAYVTSNELRESLKSITNYLNLVDKNSS